VDSHWYEVYRIRPHVLAIYEPGQFEEVISFLILGDSAALLFDTGLGFGDMHKLVASLTELPVTVLNSHGHYDHIGGNHQFATIWGLNSAYSKERAGGLDHDKVAEYASPGWISMPTPPGFEPASYRIMPYQFSSWIGDGQFIDLGGISMEVLATPGHSPDSICLIDRNNRLLFTGDTFYLAPLYAHIEQSDFEDYRASAARLAALANEVDYLVTSHNVPLAIPGYLQALSRAFEAIAAGEAHYTLSDGAREYPFDDFSVLTRNPP
jgi:glyoxylase-like metal-dependent hydrolase (beta-lactamase superfamily II)